MSRTVTMQMIIVSEPGEEVRSRRWGESRPVTQVVRLRGEATMLREKRYIFDRAFDGLADTEAVYSQSVRVSDSSKPGMKATLAPAENVQHCVAQLTRAAKPRTECLGREALVSLQGHHWCSSSAE